MKERMIAVVGRTGYGKSSKLREILASRDRVIILEQNILKAPDWGPGVEWFRSWDELRAVLASRPRRFIVGFVPGRGRFVDCLRLAWWLGDVTVFVEEMGRYFPWSGRDVKPYQKPMEWGGNMNVPGEFLEICERGRHAGPRGDGTQPVGIVAVSQRPKRLPLCFQAELDRVYSFRLRLAHDRKWLGECPGADPELAEKTKALPKFRYFNIPEEGEVTLETTSP